MMIEFHQALGSRLEWRQPSALKRYYELISSDQLAGTLRFEKGIGTLATAECSGQRWTFKRTGFWSPTVSVRAAGSTSDSAIFTPRWKGGGELVFQSGRRFLLKSVRFWGGEWAFETDEGTEIVSAIPHGIIRNRAETYLGLPAATLAETPLLILLIWYL